MPFTQTDIDNLKAAIAAGKGIQVQRHADQESRFYSVDELEDLLALMQNDVSAADAESGGSSTRYAAFSKGV